MEARCLAGSFPTLTSHEQTQHHEYKMRKTTGHPQCQGVQKTGRRVMVNLTKVGCSKKAMEND